MKMTSFQIILLSAFGALAVAGVLVFSFIASGAINSSIGPVTVWGTLDGDSFNSVIQNFAQSDHRLDQVEYVQKKSATYDADLTDAIVSGKAPDVYLVSQEYALLDRGKAAVIPADQISDSQFQNTFVAGGNPFLINGTGVMGLPVLADPLVMYWNRDILASAGFAQPPQYWDQFSDFSQQVTKKDDAGSIQTSAVALGEYQNVRHAKDILATLIMQAGGSIMSVDSSGNIVASLNKGGSKDESATDSALRFYTEFADPSKVDYSWNRSLPDSRAAFTGGQLALYIGYASEAAAITKANPNLNFAIAPMPQIRHTVGDTSPDIDMAHVYAFMIVKTGNVRNGVLVSSLLSGAAASQAFAKAIGISSARRDDLQSVLSAGSGSTGLSTDAIVAKDALLSRTWYDPDPQKTEAIFQDMIESVVSGAVRSTQAISQANGALNALLKPNQ